jgi:hypothetical protein
MTEPQTNPPNPQPPHAPTQPEPQQQQQQRPPVVVPPVDNSGLVERVNEMGRTLAGLPEQIVNSFREATQPAQAPAQPPQQPAPQPQQGGQQNQPPGTNNNPPPASQPETARGPKVSRFARWWTGSN